MTLLYQEDFDQFKCPEPDCKEFNDGPIFIHATCHPSSPTWTYYQDGVLTVICHECREVIIEAAVKERYPQ